jgi:hypothetical protein
VKKILIIILLLTASVKADVSWSNDSNEVRLIPFEHSITTAYVIKFSDLYCTFFKDDGQIVDVNEDLYYIETPYETENLLEIQYVQSVDQMFIVHNDYAPRVLSRTSDANWTIAEIEFENGPFLDENDDESITITADGITKDTDVNLVATDDIFDATHVGALWQISHILDSNSTHGAFDVAFGEDKYYNYDNPDAGWVTGANSVTIKVQNGRYFDFTTHGSWAATIAVQHSYDDGTTWEDVISFHYEHDGNVLYNGQETIDDAIYRIHLVDHTWGTVIFDLIARGFTYGGIVEIKSVADANNAVGTVVKELGSTDATYRWAEGAWSPYRGYPGCVAFYQERMVFAATNTHPQTIWFSVTDDWDNFEETDAATTSFSMDIASDQVNVVRWLSPQKDLIVGTSGAEWKIGPSKSALAFSPTNSEAVRQSTYGSALMQPVAIDNKIIYLQRNRRKVRQIGYSLNQDAWVSPDITILSEHITKSGIKDWSFQKEPYPILWCVRNDGNLAALTMEDNQEVIGWHYHTTDGDFESVAAIPDVNEYRVWFVVSRNVNGVTKKYIEQLQPFDWGDGQEDCFYVDSGLTFDGGDAVTISGVTQASPAVVTASSHGFSDGDQIRITDVEGMTELNDKVWSVGTVVNANSFQLRDKTDSTDINSVGFTTYTSGGSAEQVENTFSTLSHLDGETVTICGDGGYYGTEDVSSNTITLSDYFNKVHAGLSYTAKLRPMKMEISSQPGALFGTNMRITEVVLRLNKTLGCDVGTSWTNYDSIIFRDADDELEAPPPLFTGDKIIDFDQGYVRLGDIYIQNRIPLPITVLAIKAEFEAQK